MRAFVFDNYKQPLHEADVPEPTVGERDVLILVRAAGLNHLDERIRAGGFKAILPYKTPPDAWPRHGWHRHQHWCEGSRVSGR